MKVPYKNSKKDTDNNSTNNDSKTISNMQKKIKDQAKRLISMQEYINTLESTLRENNNQSNNININDENSEIKKNIDNVEEQNIEKNIINNNLKECLNFLKEKLISKEKEEKTGISAYNEILEEIMKIKSENEKNIEEKKMMQEKIDEYEKNLDDLRQNMDLINKLNNENNNLYNQNVSMENELNEIKNIYEENQKEFDELKNQNYLLIKDNEELHNMNNNLIFIQQENENLKNIVNNLEIKLDEIKNENNSLKDYKLGYELVIKENDELKEINNYLSNDNMLFAQDVYILKNNLDKVIQTEKNNIEIRAEINELRQVLNNLKNRKQINNVFEHISQLEKKNKFLEDKIYNKGNNTKYKKEFNNDIKNNENKKMNETNIQLSNRNKDTKYILANKYYSDMLLRILKYHVKNNANIKNILFQLLDLNHKRIILMTDIENLLLNNKTKDINKKRNDIAKKKKELENLQNTIDYYDKELKKFEPK